MYANYSNGRSQMCNNIKRKTMLYYAAVSVKLTTSKQKGEDNLYLEAYGARPRFPQPAAVPLSQYYFVVHGVHEQNC